MGTVPVYVNGARVEAPAARSVLEAVRAWDAEAARDVETGARHLTDSRGLPLDPGTPAVAGTIVRVLRARERDAADDGAA
jgi:hypothetical protein